MPNRLKKVASLAGLMIGSFAIAVMAESSWTPPEAQAPGKNVAAPINISDIHQTKAGSLTLEGLSTSSTGYVLEANGLGFFTGVKIAGSLFTTGLVLEGDNMDKIGYVLTNAGSGRAEWKVASQSSGNGGASGSTLDSSYCYATKASGTYPVGAFSGYYLKALIKSIGDVQTDGGRSSVGGVYCLASGSSDSRMTNAIKNTITTNISYGPAVFRSIGLSYKDLVNDCNSNKSSYGVGNAIGIPHDQTSLTICPALDPF